LSIINGYIENLLDGIMTDQVAMRRALVTMQKHGDRIGRIVEDMLTISKFESVGGEKIRELRQTTFDCRACLDDVVDRLDPVIEETRAKVTIDIPDDAREIAGDRFYWDQVFFNLIENALKENSEQGGLNVVIRGRRGDDGTLTLTLSDDGVGIPGVDQPFVFKRFYRVSKHHSKAVKGTGLGLSIVKRAIEAHGGTISLSSTPGVETVFTITLPTPAEADASSAASRKDPRPPRARKAGSKAAV
jgi:signal transduction histidine kinase